MGLSTVELAAVSLIFALCLGFAYWRYSTRSPQASTPQLKEEKIAKRQADRIVDREYGHWTPVPFEFPRFEPAEYDLKETTPIPYRPFKWGDYHVTMGTRTLDFADWIELDNRFAEYYRIKSERALSRGEKVVRTLPSRPGVQGGEAAAMELVHEFAEYLSRRYPDIYRISRAPYREGDYSWYREGQIDTVEIIPIGVTYDLRRDDPMTVAGQLSQDDIVVMVEGEDGRYYFQAGSVCIAGSWRPDHKFGMPLEEIHITGHVPQYQSRLQLSLARYFLRLPVDKMTVRNNYAFQLSDELAWATRGLGDEDASWRGRSEVGGGFKGFEPPLPAQAPEDVHFRSERQALRRLPRSGAVVFTVRVYLEPIIKLAQEPGIPGRMASAMRSWPPDVAQYKGKTLYNDTVLPFLDKAHADQVASGLVSEADRANTYPF